MRKHFTLFALLFVSLAMTGVSPAQDRYPKQRVQKPAQRGYFFMPPRNYFYLFPRFYPPFRLDHGRHRGSFLPHRGHHGTHHSPQSGARFYDDYYYDDPYYQDDLYYPGHGQGIYTIYTRSPLRSEIVQSNSSFIIFRASPANALVYIDGKLIGSARDFDTERDRYMVLEGEHELRIEYPGFQTFDTVMEVIPNKTIHLDIELEPLP